MLGNPVLIRALLFRDMMQPGFSKSWPDALEAMTGSREMSAHSFLTYFLPLYDFLSSENAKSNECIGWEGTQVVSICFSK